MNPGINHATSSVNGARQSRWPTLTLGLTVAAITFAAFSPAISGEFLTWDDNVNFLDNPHFRGLKWANIAWMFSSFYNGHYQPVTWLTLGLDYICSAKLFGQHPQFGYGMDPRPYHFSNVAIHAFNAALVYLLGLRLIALALYRNDRVRAASVHLAAASCALFFALHPLRVENVAWVTERRDLVSTLFLLLTLLVYVAGVVRPKRQWRWMGLALLLYITSLMAKVSGAPLPVALAALDWFPLRRFERGWFHRQARALWVEKLPFLAAALVFGVVVTRGQATRNWIYPLDVHPLGDRIMQSFYGLLFYLYKTVTPVNLLPLYELHLPLKTSELKFVGSMIIVILLSLALFVCRRRVPGLVVAAVCYAAFLGPVLGLFQNGPQLVADRYSYVPSIALAIALCGAVAWWALRYEIARAVATLSIAALIVIIPLLGWLTWRQTRIWHDSETLWRYTLAHDDHSSVANNSLGTILHRQHNDPSGAVPYFRKAVSIDPFSKGYRSNLRNALRDSGQMQELIQAWLDEARFVQQHGGQLEDDASDHYNAGTEALAARNYSRAVEHFVVSLALDDRNVQAHHNLAATLELVNRPEDAVAQYRRALQLDPHLTQTRFNLADLLRRMNRTEEAAVELQTLLQLEPDNAQARAMLSRLPRSSQ